MTLLHHASFINFAGEPITGRTPPSVNVYGPPMTPEQYGTLTHFYKLFCDAKTTMVGKYLVRNRRMADGTIVRITSIDGNDQVYVWTAGGGKPIALAGYILTPRDKDHTDGWNLNAFNQPISPDAHINTLRGFIPGANPTPVDVPAVTLHSKLQAGAVSWIAAGGKTVLTYNHSGSNRYDTALWDGVMGSIYTARSGVANIYYKGTTIITAHPVSAVGVFKGKLFYISGENTLYYAASPVASIDNALKAGKFIRRISPAWVSLSVAGSVDAARRCSAWHFSPDGSKVACAVIYDSYGLGTWNLGRARREVLPQAKRYIDLTLTEGGAFVATRSDAAFAGEPLATLCDGVVRETNWLRYNDDVPMGWADGFSPAVRGALSGAVLCTGKRLWGVDFDEAGNEILVTFRKYGAGTTSQGAFFMDTLDELPFLNGGYPIGWNYTSTWGVFANDAALIEAAQILPGVSVAEGGLVPASQAGVIESNFLTIHDIDARFKAVTAERLRYQSASPGAVCTPTLTVEWYFNAVKINEYAVPVPAEAAGGAVASFLVVDDSPVTFGTIDPARVLNDGVEWLSARPGVFGAPTPPPMPCVQGWVTENKWEWWRWNRDTWPENRGTHFHLKGYPNQVTDALVTLHSRYDIFISVWKLTLAYTDISLPSFGITTNLSGDVDLYSTFYDLMLQDYTTNGDLEGKVHGFAKRVAGSHHHIFALKNTASRAFYNTFVRARQLEEGASPVDVPPTMKAYGYYRDNPLDPTSYAQFDLTEHLGDLILAETDAVDRPTLRLDAIRVL